MAEFKAGDTVRHKATYKRGVIASISDRDGYLYITWQDGTKDNHTKEELWTEEEYKQNVSAKIPRD